MNALSIPVRRPVATSMFFLALMLLGVMAWLRIPVELLPAASGNQLFVQFSRPGSEPEVVEREMLLPLEARVSVLPDVEETFAEISGSSGTLRVVFELDSDLRVRELELRRLASELVRTQPRNSSINVFSNDLTAISRFVMFVQVTGGEDRNALLDFIEERVTPRLTAVPGVSRVQAGGGAPQEMSVTIDPDRTAALGLMPNSIPIALARSVQRLKYLGGAEDEAGRTAVVLDGRPRGVVSLANTRIDSTRAVLLRHVADVHMGTGEEQVRFRVNGRPTVGMIVFQEEGANLIRLGRSMRARLDELRDEFDDFGLDFVVNFDAAETVEVQLNRLQKLALGGFVIALGVLFLFLRQWRAVAVVAIAVPTSLLTALALLYLAGQSINLITLFGLAVGIGMLVDNSIVVYEAVQRQLERGALPDRAAVVGVGRTVRAILAASATNAVVFLPILVADIEDSLTRSLLEVMALAILLPLVGSVLVAIGLVPLLARRLAAPAAMTRLQRVRRMREEQGGLATPDRARELFGGLLTVALRRPGGWLVGVVAAVLVTVIVALTWITSSASGREADEAETLRFTVNIDSGSSLDKATGVFERLENATMALEGLEFVESVVQEQGGSLTVHLLPADERPRDVNAARVRQTVRDAARPLEGIEVSPTATFGGGGGGGSGGGGGGGLAGLLGQSPSAVILSGPDSRRLSTMARQIQERLESISEVGTVTVQGTDASEELRVTGDEVALQSLGLTADQVLPALNVLRREGESLRVGFTLRDGREIPMTVRREDSDRRANEELQRLRLATPAGVVPLSALATVRRMPPPPTILHHDGRREIQVEYLLSSEAPKTGPARLDLEEQIRAAIQEVHRPAGYTIEAPEPEKAFSWFKKILVPVVLLLFAVLAVTFESLTLPLLVLLTLPLTVIGATWALVLSGLPADQMALVGALALIGLTVNPAILLVDRMQQRAWRGGRSAGAAAVAAVRERARPVLMTSTTTVAGLWPLALSTGQEFEIWPPFATIVMGGLITSTVLTLLVIPVGFVFLHRLDRLFGRLGPWIVIAWVGATTAVMAPLIVGEAITSMTWQILTTLLVASLLLGIAVLIFRRPESPSPRAEDGPPSVEVRHLHKIYGRPGPIGRAWRVNERFAARVRRAGGRVAHAQQALGRILPTLVVLAGAVYMVQNVEAMFWRLFYVLVTVLLVTSLLRQIRRARGRCDEMGRVEPGGLEGALAATVPWAGLTYVVMTMFALPYVARKFAGDTAVSSIPLWVLVTIAVLVPIVQFGRYTAVRIATGKIPERLDAGRMRRSRSLWRKMSRYVFGLDLPREQVYALNGVNFVAERGMVGILGPNGAGKTTLLRMLAGILDPSVGTIHLGDVRLSRLKRFLARFVGYLPQDFGLPGDLTAREYLDYYALLYEIGPSAERSARIQQLLDEVGLGERADERIGGFSGGMRQRVAVARTLLRLPPVIIVDEPTVGLDPRERIRFRNLLARLSDGRVVLFSTHVVEDVEVACERVIVLARGRVVFDGPPLDLASAADGRVWVASLDPGDEKQLPAGAMVVDQIPEDGGRSTTRILFHESPRTDADATPPTLEDGYLWLVGPGTAA